MLAAFRHGFGGALDRLLHTTGLRGRSSSFPRIPTTAVTVTLTDSFVDDKLLLKEYFRPRR